MVLHVLVQSLAPQQFQTVVPHDYSLKAIIMTGNFCEHEIFRHTLQCARPTSAKI